MGEYAPDAIKWLYAEVRKRIGSAELSGIVGDRAHTYGYHRARSVLPSSDYSVQLDADKAGPADAASALDIKFSSADMKIVTARLLRSAKDKTDPRLDCLREFYGTLDGRTVTGWDCVEYHPSTSDDSHLWHVHLSVLRRYANDKTALAGVLSVITNADPIEEDDMPTAQELADADVIPAPRPPVANADYAREGNTKWPLGYAIQQAVEEPRYVRRDMAAGFAAIQGQIAGLTSLVQQVLARGDDGPMTPAQLAELTETVKAAAEAPGRELLERLANAFDPPGSTSTP